MNRLLLLAVSGALAFAALPGTPAQAHGECSSHGDDVGCPRDNHTIIDGCDRESDGNRVRTHYYLYGVVTMYYGSWDPNGANSGCAHDYPWVSAVQLNVCEETAGCGAWKNH